MGTAHIIGPVTCSPTSIPFYTSKVAAGFPSPAQDHLDMPVDLNALLNTSAPQTYMVRAVGDSMRDIGLFDGDLMLVDRSLDPKPGAIVIAAINGDSFVKRFQREAGQIVLYSENRKYPPRYVMEGDEVEVWGVVTANLRMHPNG